MTINDCRIIELPKFLDARGNLSFAENFTQIPFEVKRTYWLYDVPGGVNRGGHAEINNGLKFFNEWQSPVREIIVCKIKAVVLGFYPAAFGLTSV